MDAGSRNMNPKRQLRIILIGSMVISGFSYGLRVIVKEAPGESN
jgi:hypothetical protein